jgi:hypothetical protein
MSEFIEQLFKLEFGVGHVELEQEEDELVQEEEEEVLHVELSE